MSIARAKRDYWPTQQMISEIALELDSGIKRSSACALLGVDYRHFTRWMEIGAKARARIFDEGLALEDLEQRERACAELHACVSRVEAELQRRVCSAMLSSGDWRAMEAYQRARFGANSAMDASQDDDAQAEEAQRQLAEKLAQLADSAARGGELH